MKKIGTAILNVIEIHLAIIVLVTMILSVVIQVFCRYVLNLPLPQAFELSLYTFAWLVYLGTVLSSRNRRHLRLDVLYKKLPWKGQVSIDIISRVLMIVIGIYVLIPNVKYLIFLRRISSATLGIPWVVFLSIFPISIILIVFHESIWVFSHIKELLSGKREVQEDFSFLKRG